VYTDPVDYRIGAMVGVCLLVLGLLTGVGVEKQLADSGGRRNVLVVGEELSEFFGGGAES
jgi:hypothetical protein